MVKIFFLKMKSSPLLSYQQRYISMNATTISWFDINIYLNIWCLFLIIVLFAKQCNTIAQMREGHRFTTLHLRSQQEYVSNWPIISVHFEWDLRKTPGHIWINQNRDWTTDMKRRGHVLAYRKQCRIKIIQCFK